MASCGSEGCSGCHPSFHGGIDHVTHTVDRLNSIPLVLLLLYTSDSPTAQIADEEPERGRLIHSLLVPCAHRLPRASIFQ